MKVNNNNDNNNSKMNNNWNPLYRWIKEKTQPSTTTNSKRTQAQYVWKQL